MSNLFPRLRTTVPGPRSLSLATELRRWESPNITYVSPEFPVFWERAEGCLVTDVDGNVFLDLSAGFGAAAVGHSNPRVVAAIREQAGRLVHGMGDVHPPAVKVELQRTLARLAPGNLSQCILCTSGAESVEAALKTAMLATGRAGVVAFEGAYHGLTYGALALSGRSDFRAPFQPQLGRFVCRAPYPRNTAEAATALELLDRWLCQPPDGLPPIGAVVVEPIQGRGGVVVPPHGWFAQLKTLCGRHGALLIADEIFTGFGRTGAWFASEVPPDVLCIGKAMGGGFPIAACLATPEVMAAWGESTGEALHTSTFLGNPLGCAASLAAIAEIEERGLVARVDALGRWVHPRLEALRAACPAIAAVRGRGLMWGLELRNAAGIPDGAAARRAVLEALRRGVILLPAGPSGNVLELVPPYVITEEQLDFALSVLAEACGGTL
ncbi:MAG: aspartate aminotransferase family protein [Armatimonadota bacterium]|nr:aspartate aminotransferase family protein [Armatimonadota bacterium]